MMTRIFTVFALLSVMVWSGSVEATTSSAEPTTRVEPGKVPAPRSSPDITTVAARYEARERDARHLEAFKGGDGVSIYIGGSAVAVVLIVVLAIVLL